MSKAFDESPLREWLEHNPGKMRKVYWNEP
jgi:hypothetical protein